MRLTKDQLEKLQKQYATICDLLNSGTYPGHWAAELAMAQGFSKANYDDITNQLKEIDKSIENTKENNG